MIDLVQWRVTIGAFNTKSVIGCVNNDESMCDNPPIQCTVITCEFFPLMWFVLVYYVLNIFFQICLILSGDPGPGPVKSCPSCDAQVPLRKKVCVCGHVFHHKYRSLQHAHLPLFNATTQIPTCTSPSEHVIDVPSALDDISSRTPVDNETTGLGDETEGAKGVDDNTKGVGDNTKRVGDNTKRVGDEIKDTKRVDDVTKGESDESKQAGDKTKESVKWSRRNAMVNAKRRLQYKLNPVRKRLINQMYYNSQRDIRSQKVLHAYHANPLNAMRRMLDAYHSNPSTIKERVKRCLHH